MNQPLPVSLRSKIATGNCNAGLRYDKFFNLWNTSFANVPDDGKAKWIEGFAGCCGDKALLSEFDQRRRSWARVVGARLLYLKTDGRFVTGLGREHPVENGFAWHHTLGVPYLPGSSVKGVLRAWAHESGVARADIGRIFGHESAHHVGSVIIGDGLPTAPINLVPDVMTPHYGSYYQDETGATPPADWHDPTPIPFLAVDDKQAFSIAISPRLLGHERYQADRETVVSWLIEAVSWMGVGAKTAVGYGRFLEDKEATAEAAENARQALRQSEADAALAQRLKALGPLEGELERAIQDDRLDTDKNAFSNPPFIENWLGKLERNPEEAAIARFYRLVMNHFPELLENPHKTRGKKKKPVFTERQREVARRLQALRKQ